MHAQLIEQRKRKVTHRVTTGGSARKYAGVSVRVAKGLWFHTGGSAPVSPRQTFVETNETEEAVVADMGDVLVTNQRVTFLGQNTRGFSVPISKIAAIDSHQESDCVIIVPEGKAPLVLRVTTKHQLTVGELVVPMTLDAKWMATRIGIACRPAESSVVASDREPVPSVVRRRSES